MSRCDNCGQEIDSGRSCEECREVCLDHGAEEEETEEIEEEDLLGTLRNFFDLVCEDFDVRSVRTFSEEDLLTRDSGLVLRLRTGEVFQITVVRSN